MWSAGHSLRNAALEHSAEIESKETLYEIILYVCETIYNSPGTLEGCDSPQSDVYHALSISGGGHSGVSVVDCVLINNNTSTVINLLAPEFYI